MAKTPDGKESVTVPTVQRIEGKVRIPGSKSVTHRALVLAALADGESVINNPLDAEDTRLTASALGALGASVTWDGHRVRVVPPERRWRSPKKPIFLGNSGTSLRLLLGLAAVGAGTFTFDGSPRLRERPIGQLARALQSLGVEVHFPERGGYPPIRIKSRGLAGGEVEVDASESSQYLSSLLLAAVGARRPVRIRWKEKVASFPYVEITLRMLEERGCAFQRTGPREILVDAPQVFTPFVYTVEGDCSSASYFWAAAALTGGEVLTYPVFPDAMQGDCRFLTVLQEMGCRIRWEEDGVQVAGPERLRAVDMDMNTMPDMVPTLAVVAALADGKSRIRNVAHLRLKESDRLSAVSAELRKLGVSVAEWEDGLEIEGPPTRGAVIETYDDHRIAMAFAVLGLKVPGIVIDGRSTVAKSFPGFWKTLFDLVGSGA